MILWQLTSLDLAPVSPGLALLTAPLAPVQPTPASNPPASLGSWSAQWSPSINPVAPSSFLVEPASDGTGLDLWCAGPPYSGALAKLVSPLVYPSPSLQFSYLLWFDESAVGYGQVVETDTKVTDSAGWTYDGSFQFNIAEGSPASGGIGGPSAPVSWMTQIGNPWQDTGVRVGLVPGQGNLVTVTYKLDYTGHTMTVVGVAVGQAAMQAIILPAIPAKQLGWQPSQVVTQLQLCVGKSGGAYRVRLGQVGYAGSGG